MTGRDKNFESADGRFSIYQSFVGSRIGDIYLNTTGPECTRAFRDLCVRDSLGGGMNEATHQALSHILTAQEIKEKGPRLRKRPPVILQTDDFDEMGEFTYLELSSTSKEFIIKVHYVADGKADNSALHFSDTKAIAALTELYNAIGRDQQRMKKFIGAQLEKKHGYIYGTIGREGWDRALREVERWRGTENEQGTHDLVFGFIKNTGLFLLKTGIPLPEDTKAEWIQKFGEEPEVKMALAQTSRTP